MERKGGAILCPEGEINENLMNEVREAMFNEEFRTILRRNLFALDHGDVANRISDDLCQCLKERSVQETPQGGMLRMIG